MLFLVKVCIHFVVDASFYDALSSLAAPLSVDLKSAQESAGAMLERLFEVVRSYSGIGWGYHD
jgi:hypothetical protein